LNDRIVEEILTTTLFENQNFVDKASRHILFNKLINCNKKELTLFDPQSIDSRRFESKSNLPIEHSNKAQQFEQQVIVVRL
jgi:hypothetical protein